MEKKKTVTQLRKEKKSAPDYFADIKHFRTITWTLEGFTMDYEVKYDTHKNEVKIYFAGSCKFTFTGTIKRNQIFDYAFAMKYLKIYFKQFEILEK